MNTPTPRLTKVDVAGDVQEVQYVETQQVKDGVECDIYQFVGDKTRDLAVVRVAKGSKTPLQLVRRGDETIEIFVSGEGSLSVWSEDGVEHRTEFHQGDVHAGTIVQVGEKMQWAATGDHGLTFYEVCTPPYEDGRFEDLVISA